MSSPPQYAVRHDVLIEEIDGECLIVDLARNTAFGLNPTGRLIWRALEAGEVVADITGRLLALAQRDTPEVTRAQIAADVDSFVALLLARGLITRAEAGEARR